MTKENFTSINIIIDQSGSMSHLTTDTIGSFNSFLAEQKAVSGEAVLTLCTFNTDYRLVHDFVKLAEAYGMKGVRVSKKIDVRPAIHKAMEHKGPFLIEFVVEPEENVYPFVPPGKTIVEFLEMPSPLGSLPK